MNLQEPKSSLILIYIFNKPKSTNLICIALSVSNAQPAVCLSQHVIENYQLKAFKASPLLSKHYRIVTLTLHIYNVSM